MKITFKDVGQGDSIILEWVAYDGTERIGIVDCNLRGKDNPVVSYLKSCNYTEIAFIILSHPHTDHYSGMLELLEYADDNNITIGRIATTIMLRDLKDYWKYFEVTTHETNLLMAIQSKWSSMYKAGKIIRQDTLIDGKTMKIDDDLMIVSVGPCMEDIEDYQTRVKLDALINIKAASSAANLLSTLLKITYKDYNYLLTSDTERVSFLRAYANEAHHFSDVNFHVCQIAHHGSSKNYTNDFWSKIVNFKVQNAIASAGQGYRHPSLSVLKAFYDFGYEVYSTNIGGGMVEFAEIVLRKQKALDSFSKPAPEYTAANDRKFIIKEGAVVLDR